MIKYTSFFIACFLANFCISTIAAQDIHFSQYDQMPIFQNSAQTGIYSGDIRLSANYRNQWFSVPVPYRTFSIGAETKLLKSKLTNDVFALGIYMSNDIAGDSKLSNTNINLHLSYAKRISNNFFLLGGFNIGAGQRRLDKNALTFDDQYLGDYFNPNLSSADLANLHNTQFFHFDTGFGLGTRWQKSARLFANIGWSLSHLNKANQSFMGSESRLPMRHNLHALVSIPVHVKTDIMLSAQWQEQGVYHAFITSFLFKFHLNTNIGRNSAFYCGVGNRWGDAIIPVLGFIYQGWQMGLSYDINTSGFNVATNRNGAIELSLSYILSRLPKLPTKNTCPIL